MRNQPGDASLDSAGSGPFQGVRILDLSRVMSGPFCTAMLADLGAEVIKIELPGVGDDSRHFGPFRDGESAYFLLLNRGKKSVTLDLKSESGRAILHQLASRSDVLVENFRPGVTKRLGIDYPSLRGANPSLVYASISGFGADGPLAGRPAYDLVVQAMSGLMDLTGPVDGPPTAVGESIADVCSGMFAAWGIATSLFARERTGEGRHVEVAMLDSVFSMLLTALSIGLYTDRKPSRVGNRHPVTYPVDGYRASDGHVVMVVASDQAFTAFTDAIGHPELAKDSRFRTNDDRNGHENELRRMIEAWTSRRTVAEVVTAMNKAGIPAAPVLSIGDVLESAQATLHGMISTVNHPTLGSIPLVQQPVRFPGLDRPAPAPPPLLGEHTEETLSSLLGMAEERLADLKERNII